jgi:hypothetical protein
MEPGVGRGAPEIDILEAMGGDPGKLPNTPIERPYFSTSLQASERGVIYSQSLCPYLTLLLCFFKGCTWSAKKQAADVTQTKTSKFNHPFYRRICSSHEENG